MNVTALSAPRLTTPRELPLLISVKEVARLLGVTPRTVWRWCASGLLPKPVRLSAGCVRWRSADVLQVANEGAPPPPA